MNDDPLQETGTYLAKPPGSTWTNQQWEAITGRGKDFLVKAGAGSGKTRVLVYRILQRIKDLDRPLDIDRLLVVTFTKAAASEMKQRLGTALKNALTEEPLNAHLRRQFLLLNRASISTVHSFCMELIKKYYYLHGFDPAFRILDETEAQLLQTDIMEELLEERYQNNGVHSPFYKLVDCYSGEKGDGPLQELLLHIYTMARGHLWPELWLNEIAKEFSSLHQNPAQNSWGSFLLVVFRRELESMEKRLQEALELTAKPGGPQPYRVNLEIERDMIHRALLACDISWEELVSSMHQITFEKLKRCRGQHFKEELKKKAISLRDSCKNDLYRLRSEICGRSLDEQLHQLRSLSPLLEEAAALVKEFKKRYSRIKYEKKSADFSDLEHYALQILSQSPPVSGEEIVPSKAALECRRNYEEILVDEYQDINRVQEAILNLVSRNTPFGNRFLVGDVRQSIYRFRQAEPELFLEKQAEFSKHPHKGKIIALTDNFRSRQQILSGVNFLFSQLMDKEVGEVSYTTHDYLHCGASYPSAASPIEVAFISRYETHDRKHLSLERGGSCDNDKINNTKFYEAEDPLEKGGLGEYEIEKNAKLEEEELESAALEGRYIAKRIKELMGKGKEEGLQIFDRATEKMRPASYRDMVILLRTSKNWASAIMEELQAAGLPVYAEIDTGYFNATEIEVMISLLHIIDNPLQDIPLASVLRSPLVGLDAHELSLIRLEAPRKSYYDALQNFCRSKITLENKERSGYEKTLQQKLCHFQEKLDYWRKLSRQGALADLIWQIYRDSGYYDFVGGMPGGTQRQANLRALYDRARRYEETTFRGLFRFMKFLEKMRKKGVDFGEPSALSEAEDVVRIMTVHKSKGMEFPVVFLAGLHKQFNLRNMSGNFLLHKDMGFGPRYVDAENRIVYPTLPWLAIRHRLRLELLAEEMRILYVAMTRAEERLLLVASTRDITRDASRWTQAAGENERILPAYYRTKASSYLDWIGPPLMRHHDGKELREITVTADELDSISIFPEEQEQSSWKIGIISPGDLKKEEIAENINSNSAGIQRAERGKRLKELQKMPTVGSWKAEIDRRLFWTYPHQEAVNCFAKLSVSELNRLTSLGLKGQDGLEPDSYRTYIGSLQQRPRFLKEKTLTATERGLAYHTVMQHLRLDPFPAEDTVGRQLQEMVEKELLTPAENEAVSEESIVAFLVSPLGKRMLKAKEIQREIPFTLSLPVGEEIIILQGVIDCILTEDDGLVIIDYKTDDISGVEEDELKKRFSNQLDYYKLAMEKILGKHVKEKYLYFFNKNLTLRLD